uniref:Uncharacterized protein n=1 Tax=Quercus lobata TaxID=97700 RepID=A0A7N2MSY8_QUELO
MDEYRPMDLSLMESVWWVFSKPLRRVLFIRVSRSCHTALDTRHQSCLNLKMDVPAPEIMVTFPIISDPHKAASIDWKTTPWILPSNLAICIKANKEETNQEIMNGIPLPCVRRFFDASVREEKTCVATVGRYRKKEVILVTSVLNINTPL